jgi:RNA polymerase sigma-70 factor (ECF subfamily)
MTVAEYNRCVDDHSDGVYRFILHHYRDKDEAKDIVQDAFEKLWINHASVNGDKAKSYLFTTAYRTMIDRIRKDKRKAGFDEVNEYEHIHEQPYSDVKSALRKGLQRLPDIQKTVITLRDLEGYSYEEIGEITGLSETQVKVYIYRARTALKNFIGSIENLV